MTTSKQLSELAGSSGNSFHVRVVRELRERDWYVQISPYYLDAATNLAREIDLVAEKRWNVPSESPTPTNCLSLKLLVECKYIAQETLFWFDSKDRAAALEWVNTHTPLSRPDNCYTTKHHYLSSSQSVAKLFSSKADRNTDREAIYKAINQALHAMVYLRGRGSILPRERVAGCETVTVVELPVIVVNSFDNLHRIDVEGGDAISPITDCFQLEVNYAYLDSRGKNRNDYFLIDVVSLEKLDSFLLALESDARSMCALLETESR